MMTTETGLESEVKKEPEQTEEQPAAPELQTQAQDEPAPQQQVDPKQEHTEAEKAEEQTNNRETLQSTSGEQPSGEEHTDTPTTPKPASPSAQTSPGLGKKEKEQAAGKGISRFLPPWLKKQKSQSQVEPKESLGKEDQVKEEGDVQEKSEEEEEKREQGGEDRIDKPAEDQRSLPQDSKADEKEEKHSISSAETQPAKEETRKDSLEKDVDLKEEEKNGAREEIQKKIKEEEKVPKSELKAEKPPKKMKTVVCKVMMLEGMEFPCEVEKRAKGQVLFNKVCENINLLEKDYFGLTYRSNTDQKNWLDPAKEIKRQIRSSPWQFAFSVKFYPPDPSQLTEDITRYYLCLQLRQDIASGCLPCSFVTHALLGSYSLQAELGDYDPEEHRVDYISDFQFAPTQTKELEEKVVELHKTHRGLTPAQADAQFLENAKKLSMYGVDLHHAKDLERVDIMLGVCANGLLIYKDRLRINRFAWPKILKISYKRSNFYIKIRPGETEQFESTIGFKLLNHRAAKRLWKVCVEHHTFFRLVSPEQPPKAKFLTLGSKFRYSGRTQSQTRQASTLIDRPAPYFERTSSKRLSRSLDGAPVVCVTDHSLVDSSAAEINGKGDTADKDNGKEPGTPSRTQLELSQESKVEEKQSDGTAAAATEAETSESKSLRIEGENIYVRHSNLMLEDLDKTQEGVLKHQASISELKRSFMESSPEPRPNQWEKRLTTTLPLLTQGSLEEEITTILLSKESFSTCLTGTFTTTAKRAAEGAGAKAPAESLSLSSSTRSFEKTPRVDGPQPDTSDITETSDEKQKSEMGEEAEVVIEETVIEEIRRAPKVKNSPDTTESPAAAGTSGEGEKELEEEASKASTSSESESEDEAEYHPQVAVDQIREETGENDEELGKECQVPAEHQPEAILLPPPPEVQGIADEEKQECKHQGEDETQSSPAERETEQEAEKAEEPKVNGDVSHSVSEVIPQVICCTEPPVVKTEMMTISDTFAAQKTEISTKEVPIVHTETKTITYEAAQLDGSGDGEPGILMSAQTITAESLCTTTTTHITKSVKGGLSETRIEKRIIITGDADIDHDQALAQAIKEAKEQHPDMSVTRVVVHKETELAEDGED
ncbi:band 4.1-like protein 2 isoform X10 [Acipenser ruthenus]|uniref:band 4.1-like protein 2 isoform X10 n=1 Tax=Acipenser ruthenus TaxID=7906 RepID=UPI00274266DD|nr:band 4.1-like protein 2 isoform X10 [Acipenser ruthenus]